MQSTVNTVKHGRKTYSVSSFEEVGGKVESPFGMP